MTDKEYREIGKEFLEPIKLISMKIKSLKEDLKHLQSDITTIGAVDYSKERLSGGGTPGNQCTTGKTNILLMREYIDGESAKYAKSFTDLGKTQASELKTLGLINVGKFLHNTYYPSMYTAKAVKVELCRTTSE